MKTIILNSGKGTRLGELSSDYPKCMTFLGGGETILSWQLKQLAQAGIEEVIMTTGAFAEKIEAYCQQLALPIKFTYVYNDKYSSTNYIYSIYCAREYLRETDLLLIHGDLVWESCVLDKVMGFPDSCVAVSNSAKLPEKDFKAVIENGKIKKIGVEFFDNAVASQPLYKLTEADWNVWCREIERFCEQDIVNCYAERALNNVTDQMNLYPLDVGENLCGEIDTKEDLKIIASAWKNLDEANV